MQQTMRVVKRIARYGTVLAIAITMAAGSELSVAGFAGTEAGPDITTLDLNRDGADTVLAAETRPARGVDTTTLYLDRDGADIPAGNWWGISDYAGGVDDASPNIDQRPDITGLNLDRDGADVFAD